VIDRGAESETSTPSSSLGKPYTSSLLCIIIFIWVSKTETGVRDVRWRLHQCMSLQYLSNYRG
jgi:hypothetical protein